MKQNLGSVGTILNGREAADWNYFEGDASRFGSSYEQVWLGDAVGEVIDPTLAALAGYTVFGAEDGAMDSRLIERRPIGRVRWVVVLLAGLWGSVLNAQGWGATARESTDAPRPASLAANGKPTSAILAASTRLSTTTTGGTPDIRVSPITLTFNVTTGLAGGQPLTPLRKRRTTVTALTRTNDLSVAQRLSEGRVLAWVAPGGRAELAALRREIVSAGGQVLTLAPEGKLLVALSPAQGPALAARAGVAFLEPYVVQDFGGDPNAGHLPPGLGDRPPTPEERDYIRKASTPVDRVELTSLSVQRARLQDLDSLPAAVDNALSQYFPPIRTQGGQQSCSAWASCYYFNTYTQASDEDLFVSNGENNYIASPAFLYPLVNGGTDEGASTLYVMARLNEVGCSCWTLKPYSDADWVSWPSEAAWVDALQRRTDQAHWFDLTTNAGLAALKQHLANGHVAVTRTDVYTNWWPTFRDNQGVGIQNGVLFSHAGADYGGSHALTVVGYDDRRPYRDGVTTRYGAFLLANSWGPNWGTYNSAGAGSRGFMWVSYDYVKALNYCLDEAYYNDDRNRYRPLLYAVAGLRHAKRGQVTYQGGVGSPDDFAAWLSYMPIDRDGGTVLGLPDTQRVAVDLTDGIGAIADPTSISVFVGCSVWLAATSSGTLANAQFYHDLDRDGTVLDVASNDPGVTIAPWQTGFARATFSATTKSRSFLIFNEGTEELCVTAIASRDGDPWLSWWPHADAGSPLVLSPGQARGVTVAVDPRRAQIGRNDDRLLIYSNDLDANPCPNSVYVIIGSGPGPAARNWEGYR